MASGEDPSSAQKNPGLRRYQPGWGDDIAGYWPRFVAKWRPHDARRKRELPPEAFAAGEAVMRGFAWIQDELSKKPHTFNHGDVKPPNMFMMPNSVPAFIDWQRGPAPEL